MRVIVVGAGLAGLNAATILRARGVDVVVVEGGNRVGGRTRTVRAPFIDGQYSESGAEWVDDHHRRMHAPMERYGLRPLGAGERWMSIRRWLHHGGRMLDPEAVRVMSPSIDDEFERFDAMVADPDFRADAARASMDIDPLTGAAVAEIVRKTVETPAAVIAKVQAAMTVKDAARAPGSEGRKDAE